MGQKAFLYLFCVRLLPFGLVIMGHQKGRPDSPEPVSECFGPVDEIVTHPSKNVYIFVYLFITYRVEFST